MSKSKKTPPTIYRQGDVLIQQEADLPPELKKLDHCVIALGEATGHSHRIDSGAVQYVTASGQQWLHVIAERVELVHQEHGTIALGPGYYSVKHQREYTPEGLRNVQD